MYAYHLYHNHLSIYLFYFYLFYGLCLVAKFITIVVEFFFCLLFFPTYWCTYGIWYICTGTRFWESIYLCFTIRSPKVLTGTSAY